MYGKGTFAFGYNGRPWSFSQGLSDVFMFDIARISRPLDDVKTELLRAVREMADRYQGEEINVLYSGGMDSEVALWAFAKAKLPVRALTVLFPGFNDEEVAYVQPFINAVGIPHEVVTVDLEAWAESDACKDLATYIQVSGAHQAYLWGAVIDNWKDRVLVVGCNEPELQWRGRAVIFEEEGAAYSPSKAFMALGLKGESSFWGWSAEMHSAFLADPFWNPFIEGQWYSTDVQSTDDIKQHFYNNRFGLQPRLKTDGLTKLRRRWYNAYYPRPATCTISAKGWFERAGIRQS